MIIRKIKIAYLSLIFTITRRVVMKYFSDGLKPINGTDPISGQPIAWTWTFEDEKYEKQKYRKKKKKRNKL